MKLMSLRWSKVQPTRKRKREQGIHVKDIYYIKASNKHVVQVTKDGKLHAVRSFHT